MRTSRLISLFITLFSVCSSGFPEQSLEPASSQQVFGYFDFSKQAQIDKTFLAVPDTKLAEEHLRTLTAAPHIAGSAEDRKTAEYVAQKFREAGLDTKIVEYKIWMNYPKTISVSLTAPAGVHMNGPSREHVSEGDDAFQNDSRVVMPFNGYSPSGDAEAEVVYANYGRPEDFKQLEDRNIDVRGKIVLVRYGANFRGVKSFVAQEHGAAGVIIYSDPIDDGYFKGDTYTKGPFRPAFSAQRGSIAYMFKYPGDPTTPGVASTMDLPDSARILPAQAASMPKVPTTPLSYGDAQPILQHLGGPESPRDWQGALPFTYHVGPGPAKVKMHLVQDYAFRPIWNVIGTIPGNEFPDEWVVAGNHRDAWVYGAVDPNSGTASMLEAVHGLGELLKTGWRPKRTIVIGSWDAEEQGLIGSTEWGEEHERDLAHAAAYFNVDVAVSGPDFGSSAVPALKQFVREVAKSVPSPKGGTVYDVWKTTVEKQTSRVRVSPDLGGAQTRPPNAKVDNEVPVGDLGSGSDYTVFLQHLGIPATDVGSSGNYGVYHSVFDNFAYYKKFSDPDFKYSQQMARIFGIEILHMADADTLPYDYALYGKEILSYLETAQKKADEKLGASATDFSSAKQAAQRFAAAGQQIAKAQRSASAGVGALNATLRNAERSLLLAEGLPERPWFRHSIYAPGQYTGYAAVVIPGVNEAIDRKDRDRTQQQLKSLVDALNRSAQVLEGYDQNK